MNNPPVGKYVACPECNGEAIAIIPRGSKIVEQEGDSDGKVRVDCHSCGNQFIAHYLID